MRIITVAIVLLVPSLALAAKPKKAVFDGGVFIPAANRKFTDADRAALTKKFPDLPILTGDLPDSVPAEFVLIGEPTIEQMGAPQPQMIKVRGRGLTPAMEKQLAGAKSVWMASFVSPPDKPLPNVRRGDRVLAALAEMTGGIIYEDSARQYCSPDWWKQNRLDAWQGDIPDVARFISIDMYKEHDAFRAVSLGMEKFAQPNLVVNNMIQHDSAAIGSLMNVVMQRLVEGEPVKPATAKTPAVVSIDLDAIKHDAVRKRMLDGLLDKATKKLDVTFGVAKVEDGDPRGQLAELTFANFPGNTPQERQNAALTQLGGSRDKVDNIKHDDELLAASQRAKDKLPDLRKRYNAGLPVGQKLIIKGPFKTTKGGNEWMWVEVTAWPQGQIDGVLVNEPVDVPALKAGSKVSVKEADVFDYLLSDGRKLIEGGETIKVMEKQLKK